MRDWARLEPCMPEELTTPSSPFSMPQSVAIILALSSLGFTVLPIKPGQSTEQTSQLFARANVSLFVCSPEAALPEPMPRSSPVVFVLDEKARLGMRVRQRAGCGPPSQDLVPVYRAIKDAAQHHIVQNHLFYVQSSYVDIAFHLPWRTLQLIPHPTTSSFASHRGTTGTPKLIKWKNKEFFSLVKTYSGALMRSKSPDRVLAHFVSMQL